jgi:Domain of unknown function (DUF222)
MAAAPVLTLPPPLGAPEVLRQVHGLLDRCAGVDDLSGAAASSLLSEVDRAAARLQSLKLALVSVADKADVAAVCGASGTAAWLASTSRSDGASAVRQVQLATALDQRLPATREALSEGVVSAEHAQVIAAATAQLPADLDSTERAEVEAHLVQQAQRLDPAQLRKEARRSLAAIDRPPAEVDAHEDQVLRSQEQSARDRARFSWHHNGDGTTSGQFTLPTLAASILIKTVQQVASPRRASQRAARAATAALDGASRGAAGGEPTRWEQERDATWARLQEQDTDWKQRYGQAFAEILEHLPTDHLNGKVAATVVVTLTHDQLKASLGAAHLDTGQDLSAGEARRLACNAGIIPAVLGGNSLPVDLGRQDRFFTQAQRIALATTYQTCAAQDCDRPYAWAELHHENPWHQGGTTDLQLAVPLCGHHHQRAHDRTYRHHITTNPAGRKTVTFTRRS